jgi:hypothetical protein
MVEAKRVKTVAVTIDFVYRPSLRGKRVIVFKPGIYANVIEAAATAIVQAGAGYIAVDHAEPTDARHAFKPHRKSQANDVRRRQAET